MLFSPNHPHAGGVENRADDGGSRRDRNDFAGTIRAVGSRAGLAVDQSRLDARHQVNRRDQIIDNRKIQHVSFRSHPAEYLGAHRLKVSHNDFNKVYRAKTRRSEILSYPSLEKRGKGRFFVLRNPPWFPFAKGEISGTWHGVRLCTNHSFSSSFIRNWPKISNLFG